MLEGRRGARVATTFLVAVEGIDHEPTARKGDISATGAYFEASRNIGGVGTIHWLQLVSADKTRTLRVMAHVVRSVEMAAGARSVAGVAFEFMPDSDAAAAAVHTFVRHVLALRPRGDEPHISPRLDARIGDVGAIDQQRSATVRQLSVRSMVLETSWPIEPGESVRVDIVAPGMTRRIRLDGRAVRVAEKNAAAKTWDIEVEVHQETERPIRTHSSMTLQAVRPVEGEVTPPPEPSSPARPLAARKAAEEDDVTRALDDLLSALILPPETESPKHRVHHLSGQLASIKLPTLFALFDMERMTGRLVVKRGDAEGRIFFRDGQIVDVEPVARGTSARARIGALLEWQDGAFEFSMEAVARPNKVGVSTTALLLDLAREADEKSRDADSKEST